jgi:hypothetical protein
LRHPLLLTHIRRTTTDTIREIHLDKALGGEWMDEWMIDADEK